ncbi:hypothetical protein VST63_01795 [Mycolicibacterium sp. 050232]|uniref:hypothetical protein n=1 Tax=Mycolicibacterium sp. 050232 TaxID=3113982 RepID=UPI002E2D98DB|nr:hypothetical protein [Mycolicibacterium sp. 050232]MED5811081.1 hypothetical protein [Mycolicibacterium sp. 050232]
MEYSGGSSIVSLGGWVDVDTFAGPLRAFDGSERFALTLWALPPDMDYVEAVRAGREALEYIQSAGSAEAMTVEIRKAGGSQWGANWVRYVVGHPHSTAAPLDVPIVLPQSTEMIARHEVFGADEAAELFYSYYQSGDISPDYALRPVEGYIAGGGNIDLRDAVPRPL